MLYIKTQISENVEIKVDLYEDEIYSTCPGCGKEEQVEIEHLISILEDGGDFAGTSIYCEECSKIIIRKEGELP